MNFKQKIMCIGLLGLISQSVLPMADVAVGEGSRQVPYWFAHPYFFGEDLYKVGGKVCHHTGAALGEAWKGAKEGAQFVSEYPGSSATTALASLLAMLWLYSRMVNTPAPGAGNPGGQPPQPGQAARHNYWSIFNIF